MAAFAEFIKKCLENIVNFFYDVWQYIIQFFSDFFLWVFELGKFLFQKITDLLFSWLTPLLDGLADLIPDALSDYLNNLSVLKPYLGAVNDWIAIDIFFSLLSAYLVFILTMITVKLIVKLFIPTVG